MAAHLWREWFVAMSIVIPQMSVGIMFAFPACLVPDLTGNSSDFTTTRENALWVSSTFGISGIVSFIIIPLVLQVYGRKMCFIFVQVSIIIGCSIVALSYNIISLIIGRCLQGMAYGGIFVASVLLAEYSHPKRRGMFVTLKRLSAISGILLLHGLSYTCTWRQLAWLPMVPAFLGCLSVSTWPESPSWLAYMGRMNESITAFEKLRGKSEESEREIKELIVAQQKIQEYIRKKSFFQRLTRAMTTNEFLKPLAITVLMVLLTQCCGIVYLVTYIIEVMREMTGGDKAKAFYYTLGFDLMKIAGVLMFLCVERLFRRRTVMLAGGGISVFLFMGVCLTQYLHDINYFIMKSWLAPLSLIVFSFFCNATIFPLIILIKGEIFPLEYRGLGLALLGMCDAFMTTLTTKITSNLLISLKSYGTFLIYLVLSVASLISLYFILPETKDRTLQDIESEFVDIEILPNNEEENQVLVSTKNGAEDNNREIKVFKRIQGEAYLRCLQDG